MNRYTKWFILFLLLILSNAYLLKPGFWFFQDASYWPKNMYEAFTFINQQLHVFINYGYYLGFDQGLFTFTRILPNTLISLLFVLFGMGGSQIILSILGLILSFFSFYLFSGLFIQKNNVRYLISLVYVFNATVYALQGHTYYPIVMPLFLYAFYQYFFSKTDKHYFYLLLSILAAYIWVAYIRFIQSDFIIIFFYIIYFYAKERFKIDAKKTIIFLISYFFSFLPVLFSFAYQLAQGGQTAFNYASVYGRFISKEPFYQFFNLLPTISIPLYQNTLWVCMGMILFIPLVILCLKYWDTLNLLDFINLGILLLAFTIFVFGNIFNPNLYFNLIHYFPFVTNAPFFAFYLYFFPFAMLLGHFAQINYKLTLLYIICLLIIPLLPLLNFNNSDLQKFDLNNLPTPYKLNFLQDTPIIPEATYYYPTPCWGAKYMAEDNVPTQCINWGLKYSSISLTDPRLSSGVTYNFSTMMNTTSNFDNLRITDNLKNIILPNDLVFSDGGNSQQDRSVENRLTLLKSKLQVSKNIVLSKNQNFNSYSYSNKDKYDFFIYSPQKLIPFDLGSFYTQPIPLTGAPVIFEKNMDFSFIHTLQSPQITYKISPDDPTIYYLKIKLENNNPYVVNFNQTFSPDWKLYLISSSTYDGERCITDTTYYSITHNSRCQYKYTFLNIVKDILIQTKNIADIVHFKSNVVNNAWIITPTNVSENKTVYAVIINKKQYYFTICMLITSISFIILMILAAREKIKEL